MDPCVAAGLAGAAALAFANGANDISKSIATLVGSGESGYRKAVVLASLAVAAGGVLASAWAVKMALLFTGGMLAPEVRLTQAFALAVLAGSTGWVLLAARFGLPVSTTHAIVGAVTLTGVYAFGVDQILWSSVFRKVALPLALSPVAAFAGSWAAFRFLDWLCRRRYCLNCHWAHWASVLTSGFARGLSDTPKIAGIGFFFYAVLDPGTAVAPRWFFVVLAAANAAGGLLMGLRVTETLSGKVTRMDHLEGFAANLATSALVVITAFQGLPVSTTHVSGSAIMSVGLQGRGLDWGVVGRVALAWVVTIPTAGALGTAAYWILLNSAA